MSNFKDKMSERKYDDFDCFAGRYRNVHTCNIRNISGVDSNYFSEYKVREIWKSEIRIPVNIVLDFGCGDGNSAPYFLKYFMNTSYFGIDISSKSIAMAKQRNLKKCYFQTFDGSIIPFETGSFDVVFIAGVFHHIQKEYYKDILLECHRVMKSGGRMYIFEHNPYNPLTRKIVKGCEFDKDAELVTPRAMFKLVHETGFQNTETRFTIFFPRKTFLRHLVLFEKHLKWLPLGGQYYIKCTK